ncbi:MAG: hypothetical protein ACI9VR_005071, partial [Cognaticolwellia sp.]
MSDCGCQTPVTLKHSPVQAERPGVGEIVGTDPAGTHWRVVRYAEDWAKSTLHDLVFSPSRGVLELQ